jgi:hypothetical protein
MAKATKSGVKPGAKSEPDPGGASVGVSVRLPAELLDRIDRLAEIERRTRGNVIRIALEDWLDGHRSEKQ